MKSASVRLFAELCVLTLTIVALVMTCIVAAGLHHSNYDAHHVCQSDE